ncbi:LuxR C-terminal-related transcriptional regulator [Streptomyces sp. NPDC051677]|uniref:LuxR C-terminal-related transcriptional regulator n=1 Tax=Streptomyces sp. NPDC051677 TaxID=3365669 RepID=UPI0037CE0600
MITALIVSDQALQRLCLRLVLEAEPDLAAVGEATDSADAARAATRFHPDVVLMDVGLLDADDIQSIRHIARPPDFDHSPTPSTGRTREHPPRVLVLTPSDTDEYAYAALHAGARGFLLKDSLPDQLTAAIRILARGGSVLSPRLTRQLIDAVREHDTATSPERKRILSLLTEREREVLGALATGWSNTEIAERLTIAPTTVKTHVSSVLAKIGVRTRAQAVVFAYETGLVRPPWHRPLPQATYMPHVSRS